MINGSREEWERTFNICWGGVYFGVRTFLPMLEAADAAHIVNTSSVNGFWASLGPHVAHTSYAAAKFAVKGFSEALITDLALHAPHIKVSVVMPGHIGTSIAANSRKVIAGTDDDELTAEELVRARARIAKTGLDVSQITDEAIRGLVKDQARRFLEEAPTSAAQAATIILDGVKADRWRILVGEDAVALDAMVRKDPEDAYTREFYQRMATEAGWRVAAPPPQPAKA
jgi:NAD(P)-dependent dehydrogenase (short-subunit alcohol dehydrogenase family)